MSRLLAGKRTRILIAAAPIVALAFAVVGCKGYAKGMHDWLGPHVTRTRCLPAVESWPRPASSGVDGGQQCNRGHVGSRTW